MDLTELIDIFFVENNVSFFIVIFIAILSVIQISPIKINPWSWIATTVGKALNKQVISDIKDIKTEIKEIKEQQEQDKKERDFEKANACRRRILVFDDSLRRCESHSQQQFNGIIQDVDFYTIYCEKHKEDYANSKAQAAIENIRAKYKKYKDEDNFL